MIRIIFILATILLNIAGVAARSEIRHVDAVPYPSIFVRPAGQAHLVSVSDGPTVRRLFTAGKIRGRGQALTFIVDQVYQSQNFYLHYPRLGLADLPMIVEIDGTPTQLDSQPESTIDEWVMVVDGTLFYAIANAQSSFRFWGRLEDGSIGWISFEQNDLVNLQRQMHAILATDPLQDIQAIWQAERLIYYR